MLFSLSNPGPAPNGQHGLPQVLWPAGAAPAVGSDMVRPVASGPVALPLDLTTTALLIGGAGHLQLPITRGGGYPSPGSALSGPPPTGTERDGGGGRLVNSSLVLGGGGGAYLAGQSLQLLSPESLPPLPLLQPKLLPSAAPPTVPLHYFLSSDSPSSSSSPRLIQQPTSILALSSGLAPALVANGLSVKPGSRGETGLSD